MWLLVGNGVKGAELVLLVGVSGLPPMLPLLPVETIRLPTRLPPLLLLPLLPLLLLPPPLLPPLDDVTIFVDASMILLTIVTTYFLSPGDPML